MSDDLDLEPAPDLAAAIDMLAALGEHQFQDALAAAAFKEGFPEPMEPFVADDLLDRTHAALKVMIVTATQSAERAKRVGDDDLRARAVVFLRKVQRAQAYVKPKVKARNIAVNGSREPGTTNWRRVALDAVKLIEAAVETEVLPDGLHDESVDFLDRWDGGEYRYKKGKPDDRPYHERRASSEAGMRRTKDG